MNTESVFAIASIVCLTIVSVLIGFVGGMEVSEASQQDQIDRLETELSDTESEASEIETELEAVESENRNLSEKLTEARNQSSEPVESTLKAGCKPTPNTGPVYHEGVYSYEGEKIYLAFGKVVWAYQYDSYPEWEIDEYWSNTFDDGHDVRIEQSNEEFKLVITEIGIDVYESNATDENGLNEWNKTGQLELEHICNGNSVFNDDGESK